MIPYASNNRTTKGGQRIQKHDDGRNESDSFTVKLNRSLLSSGGLMADVSCLDHSLVGC